MKKNLIATIIFVFVTTGIVILNYFVISNVVSIVTIIGFLASFTYLFIAYKFNVKKNFFTFVASILIPLTCLIKGLSYQYFDLPNFLNIIFAFSSILFIASIIFLIFNKKSNKIITSSIFIAFLLLCGTSMFLCLNAELDLAEHDNVSAEICDKAYSVKGGKILDSYTFYVYADVNGYKNVKIAVSFKQYRSFEIGDKIDLTVGKGLFGYNYYYYVNYRYNSSSYYDGRVIITEDSKFDKLIAGEKQAN